jgi:hypothetical protein
MSHLLHALRGTGPYAKVDKPVSWRIGCWWSMVEHSLQHFGGWPSRWWSLPVREFGRGLFVVRRRLQGARSVKSGETSGSFCAPDCEIEFSGMCPVQGEGWVLDGDGRRRDCYYRSRGDGWQFHVAALDGEVFGDGEWVYSEDKYIWPAGGYVAASVSAECIGRALDKWRSEAGKDGGQ